VTVRFKMFVRDGTFLYFCAVRFHICVRDGTFLYFLCVTVRFYIFCA